MPLPPNLSGLRALESKVSGLQGLPTFKPTTSSFINNETSQAKSDPGVKARSVVYGGGGIRPDSTAQVSNYQTNLKGISSWSRGMTDQARSASLVKKAARSAELSQQRQQTQLSQSKRPAAVGVQPVGNFYSGPMSGSRAHLVKQAQSLLGTPYAWGGGGYGNRSSRGTGKGTQNVIGVDCSGLTSYVFGTLGIKLARQSDAQLRTSGYKTKVENLQPGDLVGWAKGGHVAIYVGNGMIIESPRPGLSVRARKLSSYDYNGGVYGVRVSLPGE